MKLLAYIPGTSPWRKRRDMMLCRQTAARVQELVDGELEPAAVQRRLQRHLDACRRCQEEAEAVEQLKEAIARVGREVDPEVVGHLEDLCARLCYEDEEN